MQIIQASACSSCVAKKMCNSSESKEKLVDIVSPEAFSYQVGEEVLLTGSVEMGLKAVFWGIRCAVVAIDGCFASHLASYGR